MVSPGWPDGTCDGSVAAQSVPTDSLVGSYSPRSAGEDDDHVRLLAEWPGRLPPILVHRPSLRVVDGMHRLRAAALRGEDTIDVVFFDGDESEAFVAAVRANVTHGLSLTRADREAAVERLLQLYPERSDRWIAGVAGVSPGTVAGARTHQPSRDGDSRIGRDGKARPVNSASARRVASEVIARRPDAPLREVARIAGLSPETVRDVKERMRRGEDPVPERDRGKSRIQRVVRRTLEAREVADLLQMLDRDPSLQLSESGRSALRWLALHARGAHSWQNLVEAIPPHSAYLVAEVAQACAEQWSAFAVMLEKRVDDAR